MSSCATFAAPARNPRQIYNDAIAPVARKAHGLRIDIQICDLLLTEACIPTWSDGCSWPRAASQIGSCGVKVWLLNVNGPKGDVAKHCRLQVRIRGLPISL